MRNISNILSSSLSTNNSPTLQSILAHTHYLNRLNQQFKSSILPKDYASHFDIINVREGILIVATHNNAWATRLRLSLPETVRKMTTCPDFSKMSQIKIHVHPKRIEKSPTISNFLNQTRSPLTKPTAQLIKSCAKTIKHPRLKAALLRFLDTANSFK